jgi:hypothetical protein
MKKIDRLKKEALESCDFRGHDMGKFRNYDKETARSLCWNCGMYVQVESSPAPNSIDIGGNAVAMTCEPDAR